MASLKSLKPWHLVAVPRDDLRKGVPLDAAEFAIHLDQVVDGRAPIDYRDPERFFARTFLTKAYRDLTVTVLRRLAGEKVGTSAGINLVTQFGGGKTHFLALLYHLFRAGDRAKDWPGVAELLKESNRSGIPKARVAVFIGNRFDFLRGAGEGKEPRRRTPWGDLAWQLGGQKLYATVAEHDEKGVVPGGEVIEKWFGEEPILILMDEVLNFIRRARDAGGDYARLGSQMYSFLEVLSREVASSSRAVLVVALPLSEYEMTPEDEADFQRLNKVLDRLSQPTLLSEGPEIAEIVRRRLFESVGDPSEISRTAQAYAEWLGAHRKQIPEWFPVDQAQDRFAATYPFHPSVLSVFERKWQSLPRFQRTRGILRLLALWVSRVYHDAFKEGRREPLITLGSAPLADRDFRAAVFEQLGEDRLEAAILSDIAGPEAHAVRMDIDVSESLREFRPYRQVATTVFFESSGGQARNVATLPEIRLAVGGPHLDIGSIETTLEDLVRTCYYLHAQGTAYHISYRPNLNKILADRRAALSGPEAEEKIRDRVRQVIREAFRAGSTLDPRYFPESPADIPDVPALGLVVLAPEQGWELSVREKTRRLVMDMIENYRGRARTYKSALVFAVAEEGTRLFDEAKSLLALESLEDPAERERLKLEGSQLQELKEKKSRTQRNLKEGVWRAYRHVLLLGDQQNLREVDLGLVHSSSSESLAHLIISRLKQEGLIEDSIIPDYLVRHWPPALQEWSTKSVQDAFFASPKFPRILKPEILKETIARGVREKKFGYASKVHGEMRGEIVFGDPGFSAENVEIGDEVVLIPADKVQQEIQECQPLPPGEAGDRQPADNADRSPIPPPGTGKAKTTPRNLLRSLAWEGELPPQKWSQFYMKVLTHFATDPTLRLRVRFEVAPRQGVSDNQFQEIQTALQELGLDQSAMKTELDCQ